MVESAIARKTNGMLQKHKCFALKVSSFHLNIFSFSFFLLADENGNQIRCVQFVCVFNTRREKNSCAELKFIFNLFNARNGCAQSELMWVLPLLLKYFCCESSNLAQISEHSLSRSRYWYFLLSKLHNLMNSHFEKGNVCKLKQSNDITIRYSFFSLHVWYFSCVFCFVIILFEKNWNSCSYAPRSTHTHVYIRHYHQFVD